MKKIELPCYLVEDLLPLYVDHLVGAETADAIQSHLSQCKNCTLKYQALASPLKLQSESVPFEDAGGVSFLKKVHRAGVYKMICFAVCCMFLFSAALYLIAFRQHAFDFEVNHLYQLSDGSIYFELLPSKDEQWINGISYHDGISEDLSCYEIQMGYSLLSLWQSGGTSLGERSYCFVRTPEPASDGTGSLPIYYAQGNSRLLIWDGKTELPAAPKEIEEKAQSVLSPFSICGTSSQPD